MMLLHERAVVRIDDDIPLDRASLVGCGVTTGVGAALNTAQVRPGSAVAVFGCGGVGISVIQGARIAGARQIIAIDIVPAKLDTARHFGATARAARRGDEDPVKAIKRLSGGGVDYAFDAVGIARPQRPVPLRPGAPRPGRHRRSHPPGPEAGGRARPLLPGEDDHRVDHGLEPLPYRRAQLPGALPPGKARPRRHDQRPRRRSSDIDDALAAMEAGEVTRSVIMF